MKLTVEAAVKFLQSGFPVAVPTETVYGLAAIATDPEAVARIYEIKNRPADNPLICHFYSIDQVKQYVKSIPENTMKLMLHFWPGPLSFMLDLPEDSPLRFATCGSMQVVARMPDHPMLLSLIKQVNAPLAAPSANTSGTFSPTTADMVERDLGEKIAGIVDGGRAGVGIESTIVDARSNKMVTILRPGSIGEKEMKEILNNVTITDETKELHHQIPGNRHAHYAPKTPMWRMEQIAEILQFENAVVLLSDETLQHITAGQRVLFSVKNIDLISLGSISDLKQMARNFYQNIASVDERKKEKAFIIFPAFKNSSLEIALQNRLLKMVAT